MKILHVVAGCDRAEGGVIEGVFRLGGAYQAMGHQQELLTLDLPDSPAVKASPVPVHAMGGSQPSGSMPWHRLQRWARKSPKAVHWLKHHAADYDAIVVDGLWNYSTRVARLALADQDVPYVVFPHGMLDPWFKSRYPLKHAAKTLLWHVNEGVLLRQATAAAFTCATERDLARDTWSPWKMRDQVVGFGTAPPPPKTGQMKQAFRAAVPELADRPYLLFLSRLHEKKGCEALLEGFGMVADEAGFDLVMAGPGDPAYVAGLKSFAGKVAPEGRIHWPGMLRDQAKWGALYGCEAMALTSHQENFGVVVAEALGCGRPVIISDQVNIHKEITAARAGLVCADTATGAAAAILGLSELDSDARTAMGASGRDLFVAEFDIATTAARLIKIFETA